MIVVCSLNSLSMLRQLAKVCTVMHPSIQPSIHLANQTRTRSSCTMLHIYIYASSHPKPQVRIKFKSYFQRMLNLHLKFCKCHTQSEQMNLYGEIYRLLYSIRHPIWTTHVISISLSHPTYTNRRLVLNEKYGIYPENCTQAESVNMRAWQLSLYIHGSPWINRHTAILFALENYFSLKQILFVCNARLHCVCCWWCVVWYERHGQKRIKG